MAGGGDLRLIERLTPVELAIAELVAVGCSNDEIADRRCVSVKTVEFHLTRVYRKLAVKSRGQLTAAWPRQPTPDKLPPVISRCAAEPFVGRARERERLLRLLDRELSPRPAVLISGESGIGKSMLVGWFGLRAAELGWSVVIAVCEEHPLRYFCPLDDICDGLDQHLCVDEPHARVRTAAEIAQTLSRAAGRNPMVVVIEDVHWASVDLLERIRHTLRAVSTHDLMFVMTARRGSARDPAVLAAFFAEVRRFLRVEEFALDGLDVAEVGHLAHTVLSAAGWRPESVNRAALTISTATGGVPLFVVETLSSLAATGGAVDDDKALLGHGVADAVERRLIEVGTEAGRLLNVGALMGDQFDLGPVMRVCNVDRLAAAFTLARAVSVGLLIEVPGPLDLTYQFRHTIIREAVTSRLTGNSRAALHVELANGIAESEDAPAERVAYHLALGAPASDPGDALRWAAAAADAAEREERFGDMVRNLERAAAAAHRLRPRDDQRVIEIECRLMQAASIVARRDVIESSLERSLAVVRRLGGGDALAHVALGATSLLRMGRQHPMTLAVLEEALKQTASPLLEAQLEATAVRIGCAAGDPVHHTAAVERLVNRARSFDDSAALARALIAQCWVAGACGLPSTLRMVSRELLSLSPDMSSRKAVALAMSVWAELCEPGMASLEALFDELQHTSSRSGIVQQSSVMAARRAMYELAVGEVETARRMLEDAATELRPAPDAIAQRELAKALIAHERGAAIVEQADALNVSVLGPLVAALPAWARAQAGDLAGARRCVDDLRSGGLIEKVHDTITLGWNIALLADVAVILEDRQLAADLYPAAQRRTGLGSTFITVLSAGPMDRSLGQLAAMLGDAAAADEYFHRACRFAARARARNWRAYTLVDWATASSDECRATLYARRAARIAARSGLLRVSDRARVLTSSTVN